MLYKVYANPLETSKRIITGTVRARVRIVREAKSPGGHIPPCS